MFKAYAILTKEGTLVVTNTGKPYIMAFTEDNKEEIDKWFEKMVDENKEWENYYVGVIGEVIND